MEVWGYDQALRVLRQIVEDAGGDPKQGRVALAKDWGGHHTSRRGRNTRPHSSDRRQMEGSFGFSQGCVHVSNNLEDVELVSRKLVRRKRNKAE